MHIGPSTCVVQTSRSIYVRGTNHIRRGTKMKRCQVEEGCAGGVYGAAGGRGGRQACCPRRGRRGLKSCFSVPLICTTIRQILESASANPKHEKDGLVLL